METSKANIHSGLLSGGSSEDIGDDDDDGDDNDDFDTKWWWNFQAKWVSPKISGRQLVELMFLHSIAISFEIRIDHFWKAGNLQKFDLVFSFSSVEHSGLGEGFKLPNLKSLFFSQSMLIKMTFQREARRSIDQLAQFST